MKKLFTFLFALIASVGMVFAAKDVVPSDAVLQNYYEPGQLCVCIFIPAEMACNDVVFVGTYNRDASDAWITDVKTLAKFEPVEGYDGWYVLAVNDETPADFQDKGIQGKPVVLEQDGNFNWAYQVGDVTVIRGGVTVVPGGFSGEIDLIGYTKDAPNVFIINALKANANPCTAVYHDYTFTVISDGCDGFAVPYLIGSMTDWYFQQMQVNVEKTQELGASTYYYKCRCAEGTRYQVLSGLKAADGSIAEYPTWDAISYLEQLVDDVWVPYTENGNVDLTTGANVNITFDVRQKNLRWARCAAPEEAYEVAVSLTAPAGAPAVGVEIIGDFDDWGGTLMTLENGKYTATVSATPSQKFKFREAGTWDNEIMIADAGAEGGWKGFPTTQFQSVWEPAAEEGKMVINLDLSNPTVYRWKETQTITGTRGDNLTWEFDAETGVLTISGTGAMADYQYDSPWNGYRSSIKSVIINDGVTSIGTTAFSICSSLTSVTIGNSVTEIGDYAFESCPSLNSVTIGDNVTSIGKEAFSDCTKLSSVIIPKSVVSIGEDVFGGSYLLSSISVEAGNPVYDSRDNCNAIIETTTNTIIAGCPNTIIPNSVTAIGNYAFAGFISITSFDIPNQIVKIGNSAFGGCENLSSVTIPNSVISIGEDAFSTCPSLTTITIPSSVKEIMRDAFWGCSSMSAINFESQIPPTMGVSMFYGNDCSIYVPCGTKDAYVAALNVNNIIDESRVIETVIASGYCGADSTNLTWELSCDSVLTISGTGAMADYTSASSAPWYDYRSSILSVVISDGVTSIGDWSFYDCSSLTSVAIPNSVTSIREYAFLFCSSLTSVTLPNSVTSIGDYAFRYCSSLTSVTIPNSVTSIGFSAFSGCTKLSSVIIPKSVVSIGEDVFGGSYLLSSISVEAGNPVYDSRDNCNAIIETTTNTIIAGCPNTIIPNSVTAIGNYAFAGFISITSFDIPNQIVKIGNSAFGGCENLSSVTIPNSVISIGEDAFSTCPSLTTITIPSSVKEIMRDAFWGCSSMSAINFESQIPPTMGVSMFYMNDCSFYVPCGTKDAYVAALNANNTIDESRVIEKTFIASGTCGAQGDNLTWELSCDSVLTISGTGAMADYPSGSSVPWYDDYRSAITTILITDGVTSIGRDAFLDCSSLTSITIPNSVTSIEWGAFEGCSSLTFITIPNSVTSIGIRAFLYCSSLTSITIPNSVTSIGDVAFADCSSLTSITIPNSVTSIGNHAFYGCSSLTSVTIPNGVTSIGVFAFSGCSSLTSITIPNSVTSIGDFAFSGCKSLASVTIGNSVTSIGNQAFENCTSLTSINVDSNNPNYSSVDGVLFNKDKTTLVACPGGKQGAYTIPNSVTSIGESTFYNCSSLTSVTIPNSVKSIGYDAFRHCTGLTSIAFEALNPPSFTNFSFYDTNNCPIYVPCGTKDAYVAALIEHDIDESRVIEKTFIASGTCGAQGDNLTWELSCDSVLTISGTGAMADYAYASKLPWYGHRSAIKTILINDGVTSIGDNAFCYCISLTSVTIGNSVKSIGNSAFSDCWRLDALQLPESVTSIGNSAFAGCFRFRNIHIPKNVSSIGTCLFQYCSKLVSITVDTENPIYDSRDNCNAIIETSTNVLVEGSNATHIPETVVAIGKSAFANKNGFRQIDIPNSITSIGEDAFINCDTLESLVVPTSVSYMGRSAFYQCSGLKTVEFKSVTPPNIDNRYMGGTCFLGTTCDFLVPCGTKEAYVIALNYQSVSDSIDESRVIESEELMFDYTISSDNTLGSVTITQEPTCTAPLIFRADAAEGYQFTQWSDGNTDNPRSLILTQDTTLKAEFELCTYTVTWLNYDSLVLELDTNVIYGTMPSYDSAVPAKPSTAEYTYTFAGWSPEVVATTEDATYTATYTSALRTYSVLVYGMNDNIILNGTYPYGESILVEAIPEQNYQFAQWSDGNTDNPRSLILTQDTVLKALFEQIIIEQDTIIVTDSTDISDIITGGQDTIPHVEVQPGGEITIDRDDIGIGVITIITIGTESGQVHPWDGGYDNLKNTRVVMEYVLEPLKQQADPNKWYAFTVPFEVDIETGVTRKYGNKSHVPGKDFMILEYDSELRSRTGSGWKEKKSGLLEPGHFYMLGIEGNCNRWLFEKVRDADVVGDKEKDLQHYAHGNSKNDGWHGLGNTTLEYVDMSFDGLNATYVYIYDNQIGKYNIYSIEELILAVGQPFFTQGDNNGSVAFTPNNGKGKGNGKKNMPIYAPSYDVQPSHPRVLLTIETEKINATPDRLYITLHDDNQCGSYRIGRDFMRMDKGSKQVPNFWCPMADGTQLSAHGISMPTTYTTIPLGIFTPAKGEYTINAHMQDMNDYIVELYYQNVCLGILMQGVPFRLEMAAGTSYEYSIRISRRVSTDLNPAEYTQCDKDNKWYDVLGRPLPQDAHGIFIRKGEKIIK